MTRLGCLLLAVGVTWLLTNIASKAEAIPKTAPVCALLQCHQVKAMPSAMKACTSAVAAADSCLTQLTMASHTARAT